METGTAVIKGKEMLSIQECWRGRHFEQHVKLPLRTPASHVRMPGTGATSASHPASWRQQMMGLRYLGPCHSFGRLGLRI